MAACHLLSPAGRMAVAALLPLLLVSWLHGAQASCAINSCADPGKNSLLGCLKCSYTPGASFATFYTDGCKCDGTISWISCRGAYTSSQASLPLGAMPAANACGIDSCDSTQAVTSGGYNYQKCSSLNSENGWLKVSLPSPTSNFVYLQFHDGQLTNDGSGFQYTATLDGLSHSVPAVCDSNAPAHKDLRKASCSGGGGNGCGTDSVCMLEFDLARDCAPAPIDASSLGADCAGGGSDGDNGGDSDNGGECSDACSFDSDCPLDAGLGVCARASCTVATAEERAAGSCNYCEVLRDTAKVCRPKDGACDVAEVCGGSPSDISYECPADQVVSGASNTLCRQQGATLEGAPNPCDKADYCDGTHKDCPQQVVDTGYSFKCGTDCYLCGVTSGSLTSRTAAAGPAHHHRRSLLQRKPGSTTTEEQRYFGGIQLGSCANIYQLEDLGYPNCQDMCVAFKCPNGKDLSNMVFGQCDIATGTWTGTAKYNYGQEVGGSVFSFCRTYWELAGRPQSQTCGMALNGEPVTRCNCLRTETIRYMGEEVTVCRA